MLTVSFSKFQGAGNDFLLIDDREEVFPTECVPSLCHRKFGVGADGVLLVQNDSTADVCMRTFNADGSEAESCGNGLRCFMKFLLDLGFQKKQYHIRVKDQIVLADFVKDQVSIHMQKPPCVQTILKFERDIHLLNTGVPHAVIFSEDSLSEWGPKIQNDPLFSPEKINVNIAQIREDHIVARTFERGAGETLACGTGAVAIGYIAMQKGWKKSPVCIRMPGGDLWISEEDGGVTLLGDARKVFEGRWIR